MRTMTYTCIVSLFIISISCNKDAESLSLSPSVHLEHAMAERFAGRHFIGEHFGGGIVFYLDKTGRHGLIAAPDDFEEPAFWSQKDMLNGAASVRLGAGAINSIRIRKTQGDPTFEAGDYAALECLELDENGYHDWYLPSKNELNEMYRHKKEIGGFQPAAYWSSTEADATKAWFQNFYNGLQVAEVKVASYPLRPVRNF